MDLEAKSIILDAEVYYDLIHRCAACHCVDCANKELIGSGGHVYCRKTNSWRDADDFCKHAQKEDENEEIN